MIWVSSPHQLLCAQLYPSLSGPMNVAHQSPLPMEFSAVTQLHQFSAGKKKSFMGSVPFCDW